MRALLLAIALSACVTDTGADSSVTATDWRSDYDDGFGYYCEYDPSVIVTHCYGTDGHDGICDVHTCRRTCAQTLPGCPKGQHRVSIVSDLCVCEPNVAPWVDTNVAPAMEGE